MVFWPYEWIGVGQACPLCIKKERKMRMEKVRKIGAKWMARRVEGTQP